MARQIQYPSSVRPFDAAVAPRPVPPIFGGSAGFIRRGRSLQYQAQASPFTAALGPAPKPTVFPNDIRIGEPFWGTPGGIDFGGGW